MFGSPFITWRGIPIIPCDKMHVDGSPNPQGPGGKTSILLSANNIFDVEARRASSVLKDFAPLAGRDLRVTLRVGV